MNASGPREGVVALAAALVCGACSVPGPGAETAPPPSTLESALADSRQWIDWHEPARSFGGYTLALFQRRVPFLMDMDGRVVHTWPDVRVSGRARLMPSGHLGVLASTGRFEEYDWEGRLTWEYTGPPRDLLHHDFARLRNGNHLFLVGRAGKRADALLEVDRSGHEVWRWSSWEALAEILASDRRGDRTHMNSVQELPPNPLYDQGHEAFRPGNILVSARNLNTLYVVARPGGEVVWRYDEELDWQHEARMIPAGFPGAGHILVFNNRYHDPERRSTIVELDPVTRAVTWSYQDPAFFSGTGGTQQALPNGNLLVTSSRGGRVFELTREGDVVWQWAPPFLPMRASRYPADFCPQLASLGPPSSTAVRRRDPGDHVDVDLYRFARTHEVYRVETSGEPVELLARRNDCQRLRLPASPRLTVGYGIRAGVECDATPGRKVRFGVSIRPDGAEASDDVWARAVAVEDIEPPGPDRPVSLRHETVSLERFGGGAVEMCVSLASFAGGPIPDCFVWGVPGIKAGTAGPRREVELSEGPEVQDEQRRQLEALGYVN